MRTIRGTYDHLTPDGIASASKHTYVVEHSSTHLDGTPCDWDKTHLSATVHEYQKYQLGDSQIRELAKTDPWMGVWQTHKTGSAIFPNAVLDIVQKRLISWSSMYDSIHEAAEPPSRTVIEDDDMLDGWLAVQRKKQLHEEDKQTVEGQISHNEKIAGAGEIYLMAETRRR